MAPQLDRPGWGQSHMHAHPAYVAFISGMRAIPKMHATCQLPFSS